MSVLSRERRAAVLRRPTSPCPMLQLHPCCVVTHAAPHSNCHKSETIHPECQLRPGHRGTQSWKAQGLASQSRHGVRGTHACSVCSAQATTSRTACKRNAKNLAATLYVPHPASSHSHSQAVSAGVHRQQVELQMDEHRILYRQQLEHLFSGMRIRYNGEVYLVGGWGGSTESGMWTRLWITPSRCVPAVKCIPLAGIPCARWRRKVKSNAFLVFDPQGNIIGIGQDWYAQQAKEKADNILAQWALRYRIKPQKDDLFNKPFRTIT